MNGHKDESGPREVWQRERLEIERLTSGLDQALRGVEERLQREGIAPDELTDMVARHIKLTALIARLFVSMDRRIAVLEEERFDRLEAEGP